MCYDVESDIEQIFLSCLERTTTNIDVISTL